MTEPFSSASGWRLEAFGRKHRTGLVTLVFTDIVGSTALKRRLGEGAAVELIQRHHGLVRQLLGEFEQAEEIETAGDSFLLVFARPSEAVTFALRLIGRLGAVGGDLGNISDRIGVHLGEVYIQEVARRETGRRRFWRGLAGPA